MIYILTNLFLNINLYGQTEYRYFEITSGEDTDCARVRFFEINEFIKNKDFTLLRHIYPRLDSSKILLLDSFSTKYNIYKEKGLLNSGAARKQCDDCEKTETSFLIYSQSDTVINDLLTLTVRVEKYPPFLIDTIIIEDTLRLSTQLREDLIMRNIGLYPPLMPPYPALDCFGSGPNFKLKVDESNKPYLDGLEHAHYDYSKLNRQYLQAANKMNLPIKLSMPCVIEGLNCLSGIDSFTNITELRLVVDSIDRIPTVLLESNSIERLVFIGCRALKRKIINFYIDEDDLSRIKKMREISFIGSFRRIFEVRLPFSYKIKDSQVKIKGVGDYVHIIVDDND